MDNVSFTIEEENGITGIVKGNVLCVLILAAVFLPQSTERIAFADLFHNLRVVCQDRAAAAFLRRSFQCPAQRRFVTFRAAQRVQDMYVVIISRTGIRNVAGQHSFQLFRQYRFKVVGKNTDRAVIEQQGECVFHLTGRYHVARGDIHRQRYADRWIVRFQRNPDTGVIVGFPNVRDADNLKLHVVGDLDSANLCKDFADCFMRQGEALDRCVQIHCCPRVQSHNGGDQESAFENEIVLIGRERDPFQQPFQHIVLHDELRRDMLLCRFVLDKGFQLHRVFCNHSKTSMYRSTLGFTRSWSAYCISL